MKRTNKTVLPDAALLILPRLFTFFCGDAPYSAAYACGMLLAAVPQAAAVLLLTLPHKPYPPVLLRLCRIGALFYAAELTVLFRGLCRGLLLPHCGLMLLLLFVLLLYTVPQGLRASGRAAGLLFPAGVAAILLLPAGGLHALRGIALFTPDSTAAGFLREWRASGELLLIPLLMQNRTPESARKSLTVWAAVRSALLPLLVLFGAVQNGRLLRWTGNPFFLLLARTPLSEAIRTDGLWILYAFVCGAIGITFCLQAAEPLRTPRLRMLLPYFAACALFLLCPSARILLYSAAPLFGILLPAGYVLLRQIRREPA